jgi:hypothetical protein
VIHALVADAAFHREQIEIDTFGVNGSIPQRLEIIVFIERDCKFEFCHFKLLPDNSWRYDIAASNASQ